MNDLLNLLESLNRKERFFLVGNALDNKSFSLGACYRSELEKHAGVKIPDDAWVAMDYHLDWIAAAAHLATTKNIHSARLDNPGQHIVRGNQEDVDLIVGFGTQANTTLILIEAKGHTAWSKTQMDSKVKRLGEIFGTDVFVNPSIKPILVLTSPKCPSKKLGTKEWPEWMTNNGGPRWMPMTMPKRRQLIRCDENGKSNAKGQHAKIVERS
jgi:hypothetical protein